MKMNLKKVMAMILVLAMLTTSVPLPVRAEETGSQQEVSDTPQESTAVEESIAPFAAQTAGITLELTSETPGVCTPVIFTVTAPGADTYTLTFYDGDRNLLSSSQEALTDGTATFESWVYVPSTEIIAVSAAIDGETYTDEMRVEYVSKGKVEEIPVITSTETPYVRQSYTLSWEAVEGASSYYLYWENPNGGVTQGTLQATSFTMPASRWYMLGDYEFRVAAIREGYEQGDFAQICYSVTQPLADDRVSITATDTDLLLEEVTEITVTAPDAEKVMLYNEFGGSWAEVDGESAAWMMSFGQSERLYGAALYDGTWVYSELLHITVTSLGTLAAPVVTMPETIPSGQALMVSWEPVENAEYYWINLQDANGNSLDGWYASGETSLSIPMVYEAGTYTINVVARASGWDAANAYTTKSITVTGEAAAAPEVSVSATEVAKGETITVTVKAPGASQIIANWSDWGEYTYSVTDGEAVFTRTANYAATVTLTVSACIDGAWSQWSEPIEILMTTAGELAAPVLTVPETLAAGQPLTVSWSEVENADSYSLELLDSKGGQIDYAYQKETSYTSVAVLEAGTYTIRLYAHSDTYSQSSATARITVTGELAAPPALSLDAQRYVPGDKITYTVGAEDAEQIRLHWYGITAEGYNYDDTSDFAASGAATSFSQNFYTAGSFYVECSVMVNGGWSQYSSPVAFEVAYKGALAQPVVQMQDSYTAGESITVSWNAVENAQYYSVRLYDQSENYLDSWYVNAPEASVVMDAVLTEGDYCIYVEAYADGWKSGYSEKQSFAVTGVLTAGPAFTVDTNEVVTGRTVTFTVSMEGADSFRLLCGSNTNVYDAENGTATFTKTIYGNPGEVVTARISACIDGVWTDYGPAQEITILDKPALEKTVITVPVEAHAGEEITLSWTAVESAENYTLRLYHASQQVWSDFIYDGETTSTIPAGTLKQGTYQLTITAAASGYHSTETGPVQLDVLAPLPGSEYRYGTSSDGTAAYLYDYLAVPVPSEIQIPDTLGGATVTHIYAGCFEDAASLTKVTIPASVTYISDTAFEGVSSLVICGYTGSVAESFALLNGHTFVALDDGEGDICASWTAPVLIHGETIITVDAPGATEVRMYVDGNRYYSSSILLIDGGATVTWTPTEAGTRLIRFEALVDGTWLTTGHETLEVISYGSMPAVTGLTASATVMEPGTPITLSWTAPEGVEAAEYQAGIQSPDRTAPVWFSVAAGNTSHTFSDYWVTVEGSYCLWVRVKAQPGYEDSQTSISVEVESTQTWDYIPSRKQVVAYHGTDKAITIPSEIDGQQVTGLGASIFEGSSITSVVIPEGITSIGSGAFASCSALASVTLPETLKSMGSDAFRDCTSLTSIQLPASISSIPNSAFEGCTSLTSVELPASVRYVYYDAFSGCSALSQVTLPDGITHLYSGAFRNCSSLEAITIPQSVISIGDGAFSGCSSLTIYGYSGSEAEAYAAEQDIPFVALDTAQTGEISFELASQTVYAGGFLQITVTAPEAQALRLHVNDAVYTGTATMTYRMASAGSYFVSVSQCVNGQWLTPCEAKTVTVVAMEAPVIESIAAVPAYTPVTVRWKNVEGAAHYSLTLMENGAAINFYSNIVTVDEEGYVCQQLAAKDVAHEGIYTVHVAAYAADGGSATSERAFEVTDIADAFLYELNEDGEAILVGYIGGAEEVVVPEVLDGYVVTQIAEQAFMDSTVVHVTLPATIRNVAEQAFYNCAALKRVTISDAQAVISAHVFQACPALMEVTLGSGVFVEPYAFSNCRTDMIVYGYAGGNVEEEARSACQFSSLGDLAEGPAIEAEDIWHYEQLDYAITLAGASEMHVQITYPDGKTESTVQAGDTLEGLVRPARFADMTEDGVVSIRSFALVNGAWTAYSEKEVKVTLARELQAPVIHEIGSLARHLDHQITWDPVENAQSYHIVIYQANGILYADKTQDASLTAFTIPAGSMPVTDHGIVYVTAVAEGYLDAAASAVFQVFSVQLDTPEIMVEEKIARHLGAVVSWTEVDDAQWYTVTVTGEDGQILCNAREVQGTSLTLSPSELEPGDYTVSLRAHAPYCTDSAPAEGSFQVYEEQLTAPVFTVPETVIGGESFEMNWQGDGLTERYTLEFLDEAGNQLAVQTYSGQTQNAAVCLPLYGFEGMLTVRLTARALYYTDGTAEQKTSYKPLYAYAVVDGTAVITAYNGTDSAVWVPDSINGYPVIAIGDSAFEGNTAITSVYMPESVTAIGARAFRDCTALASVTGEGVTAIGDEAFYNCISLRDVNFGPNQLYVSYGWNVFYRAPVTEDPDNLLDIQITEPVEFAGNPFISEVVYGEGITEIPARTHYNNLKLQQVYLPESLRRIGSEAFAECPELGYVRVYDDVAYIAEDAFANSPGVRLYIYTGDMDEVSYAEQYAIDNGIAYTKVFHYDPEAEEDTSLVTVRFAEGTYRIGEKACYANTRLGTVYLPDTVETVDSMAFAQCGALHRVYLYDTITAIAGDAFEGSTNVEFILYVSNLEEVSYAESYAVEHGIPFQKYELPPETETEIDVGDGIADPAYIGIDTTVSISIGDIPAEADWLEVYLDGQPIRSMATDGCTGVTFSYTFREFGEHALTAQAYQNGEVIKLSWVKPVIVTGIRITADRESAWTGEIVNFTVEAYPEVAEVQLYAEDQEFGTVQMSGSAGSFAYAFTKAGDREITARTNSGLQSETLVLPVLCLGVLEQPVLEADAIQFMADGLVCSWNTTEYTDGYVLRVRTANGTEIAKLDIPDDGSGRMTYTLPADSIPAEGSYQMYLMNYGYQYSQNESEVQTVLMMADGSLAFTMDKQTVTTGEDVSFTFVAPGAAKVELWVDGDVVETIALENGRANFRRAFTKSGDREIAIRAWGEDGWSDLSDVQILQVTSMGQLDAVQVAAAPTQLLGNRITASWSPVDRADGYAVYFRTTSHETVYQLETQQLSVQVPGELVTETGEYYFMVVAYGAGYDQSEGQAAVAVQAHLPGPEILTPGANESVTSLTAALTWAEVSGAESYVVSLARKTGELDAYGQPVYEKVWASPNETVNVGKDLSYSLSGLAYGEAYRVAVGSVVTLEDGTERIGWSEQLFQVTLPALTVTVSADVPTPYERQQVTIQAVASHTLTQAVLTDETGGAVNVISSASEIVDGKRVFTFVVSEQQQGDKTYTVTVTGTDEIAAAQPGAGSVTVHWQDADTPVVTGVEMRPANAWPDMNVTFTVTANSNTVKLDVYWVSGQQEELICSILPDTIDGETVTFHYDRVFSGDGDYLMRFVPVNAYDEWTVGEYFTCTILPKGKLPAPKITNLTQGDIIPQAGYRVNWDPVELPEGMTLGGYSVTVYSWDASAGWKAMPGQYNVPTSECSYLLPDMTEGGSYRIEVYTLESGKTEPSAEVSGCAYVEFTYRTVPDFQVVAIETEGILQQPVSVSWNAPVWPLAPGLKPDSYVVYWYRWDTALGTVEVFSQVLDGNAVSATLPGDLVTNAGGYTVDVYALLGASQAVHSGNHAFTIVPPEVELNRPTDIAAWLANETLMVDGIVKGGVTHVLVRLVDGEGNPVALKDTGGTTVKQLIVPVVNGSFAAQLNPVNPLAISAGVVTNYAVQAFGFLSGQDMDINAPADSDEWSFSLGEPKISGLTVNNCSFGYWLFHDEWMTVRVTANQAVMDVQLYDNGQPVAQTFTSAVGTNGNRVFTSGSFNIRQQGLHVIKACDAARGDVSMSMNVYVVERTADLQVQVDGTVKVYSMPGGSREVATVNADSKLVQKGICGEYVLVVVDGFDNLKGFIHKNQLGGTYVITYPFNGANIDIQNMDSLTVQWEAYPGAATYRVTLTVTVLDKSGEKIAVPFSKTVSATEAAVQSTVFSCDDILNRIVNMHQFTNTTWSTTIAIEAYGE